MRFRIGLGTLALSLSVLLAAICVLTPETEARAVYWGGGGWGGMGCAKPGLYCRPGGRPCCRGYTCWQGRCMNRGRGFGRYSYYDYDDYYDYYDYIF